MTQKSPKQLGQTLRSLMQDNCPPDIQYIKELIRDGADLNCYYSDGTGDIDYDRPLHIAIRKKHYAAATLLIDAGADLEASGSMTPTPLAVAAEGGHLEMVEKLVAKGAQLDAQYYGISILMNACYSGNVQIIKFLLKSGATAQEHNRFGNSAYKICRKHNHAEAAKLIKQHIREERYAASPSLKKDIFERAVRPVTQPPTPIPIRKFKPKF